LWLDLNHLAQKGFIKRGANIGGQGISWTSSHRGEIASGLITADMSGDETGWFRIKIGSFEQRIMLFPRPRHFGGRQWYFVCPTTNRLASVLWKPAGATQFCSRQTWGRQVAYQSQFNDPTSRAHAGRAKIKSRLISRSDKWEFPPKPKWMRWATYDRHEREYDRYEGILLQGYQGLIAKLRAKL
jgi:hypothetical protein